MIELFDPARLLPRRDHTPFVTAGVLLLGAAAVGSHALWLQQQLGTVAAERRQLSQALAVRAPAAEPAPPPALLADLEGQAERLEAAAGAGEATAAPGLRLTPSQWLERLDALSSREVALLQVEIDHAGSARVEGHARSPQALAAYVQAWERLQAQAPLRARAVEVRQDTVATAATAPGMPASAALLRFALRAQTALAASAAAPARRPAPAP